VKISPANADRFASAPPEGVNAVLLYGPDAGLVRERGTKLLHAVVDDPTDPFRIADLTVAAVREDQTRLADEAAALSLTGGRRVVSIKGATDTISDVIGDLLKAVPSGSALIVVETGDLGPRSKLRKVFEGADNAAAIACYSDDGRAVESLVREVLSSKNLSVSHDALRYLCDNLGGDRLVTRSELEKLTMYMGDGGGEITLSDAVACVGDSANMTLDDLAFAAASGDLDQVTRLIDRTQQEGATAISVLRVMTRHFQRLHLARGLMEEGKSPEEAMKSLRPPVFFKQTSAFRAQCSRWTADGLATMLELFGQAEAACKTTGAPSDLICGQLLLRTAIMARRTGRQR
jgi:DNA polymerase-3 subunit delta